MIRVSLRTITRERFDEACLRAATHPWLVPHRSSHDALVNSGLALIWAGLTMDGHKRLAIALTLFGLLVNVGCFCKRVISYVSEKREARS